MDGKKNIQNDSIDDNEKLEMKAGNFILHIPEPEKSSPTLVDVKELLNGGIRRNGIAHHMKKEIEQKVPVSMPCIKS